jgi:hypothetical protein
MIEQPGQSDGAAGVDAARLRAAQAKWERLTPADYDEIRTVPELIAKVAERYSLPHEQAKNDVEMWARDTKL